MRCWIGMAMAAILFAGSAGTARSFDLPTLQGVTGAVTDDESRLGRTFLRKLRADTPVLQDPVLQDYLENLGYRIAFGSGLSVPDLQVILIPDREINAFAVPGGVMGVNTGLFLYAESESELAAVIAHEIAHITQRHYDRSREAQKNATWLYLGALLTSIAVASHSSGDGGLAIGATAQAAMIQQQLAYSRQQESEADRIGMQTLIQAGFDPNAMTVFFSRMDKEMHQVGAMPEFLMTHPITRDRIAESALRARNLPVPAHTDTLEYRLARVRALSLMNPVSTDLLNAYRKQAADAPEDPVSHLALLLACIRARQFAEARVEYGVLHRIAPDLLEVAIAGADIELADRRPDTALTLLRNALLTSPDSMPLRLYAANAATLAGKPELAVNWLDTLTRERPEDPAVWQLMTEARLQLKDPVNVLRSRAEWRFLDGQGDQAVRDLEEAARQSRDNYPVLARINARLEQMRQRVREDKDTH